VKVNIQQLMERQREGNGRMESALVGFEGSSKLKLSQKH
jgi:hypothetical protein